jgi:DNA-binding NtrC family response regulator
MAERDAFDADAAPTNGRRDLKQLLESYERALIVTALAASGGNQRQAAQQLGLLPTTLNEKMKRLGLRGRPLQTVAAELSAGGLAGQG